MLAVSPSDRCGSDWVYDATGVNCYKYSTTEVTWSQADTQCHYEGGRLVSITGQDESDFVFSEFDVNLFVTFSLHFHLQEIIK